MYSYTSTAEKRFLSVLSFVFPKPVSSWASLARRSASVRAAAASASTMRSTCSCENSLTIFWASRAAAARARACWIERRSLSRTGLAMAGGGYLSDLRPAPAEGAAAGAS
jgi:hypothetical protein